MRAIRSREFTSNHIVEGVEQSLDMTITQLTLHNFRNHINLRMTAGPGFIALSGDNGAGKTNILEAVSLLTPGRGLRRAALSDMANDTGTGDFAVAAKIGDVQLGTGTSPESPQRRKTRVNGAAVPTNDLAHWLSILWLTPAMDRLFIEGATGRRNFLDRLITALEPAHARNCARYDAARRERNRLLSEEYMPDNEWLDALDAQLANFGSAVAETRFRLVGTLNERLSQADDGLFAAARLELLDHQLRREDDLLATLASGRQADRAAGRTLHGPHRTDLHVFHRAKSQAAEKCSTGEQKALLFSIILGQADLIEEQRGGRPILLLDEVAAHLDPARRAGLFSRLEATGGQIWLTGTEPELFANIPSTSLHFEVREGRVTKR
ncbi:DNA recombination and repair protein RecF [hydrothermal vent metagenome]|uniref:DNA replication and repair protein RecF n=1 Tax=hydrothermal vent metagenome TaxID=652676 RepID=A0A3B0S0C7_9ZZZZ